MILSILKRYPNLTLNDVELRNDGDGTYIEKWNSADPQPSMEEVLLWVEEDKSLQPVEIPTDERIAALEEAMNFILLGGI